VQLPHFAAAAHVVHQIEVVSYAAYESHVVTPSDLPCACSVSLFHYAVQSKSPDQLQMFHIHYT
jgi:hypothetical protein